MFICGMVLRYAGILKPGLSLAQLQQITVMHNYKLLINDVKLIHSLTLNMVITLTYKQIVVSVLIWNIEIKNRNIIFMKYIHMNSRNQENFVYSVRNKYDLIYSELLCE